MALVGRSNVGKSSLINALVRQHAGAHQRRPGKTRLANFYRVQTRIDAGLVPGGPAGLRICAARAPQSEAVGGGVQSASTEAYFGRPGQRAVLLLVDSRHPGLASDLDAWEWMRSQPCARGVVGTKVDKLTRAERARHVREFETLFDMPVALVSALTGEGLDELWKMIASLPSQTAA